MQDRATSAIISPRRLAADVAAALLFSTRLPVPGASAITGADIARAGWALPVAGAIVGLISALVYWLARVSGLPPLAAAGLTIAASLAATGCLHEDGLADFADSVGAGRPSGASAIAAVIIGIAALGIGLGPAAGACAIALMAAAFGFLRWLCMRQIGGQTGDVLGALEQIGEIVILLVAATSVGN